MKFDGKILVVGDLMLDHFIYGQVNRVSPEAPVPVVEVEKTVDMLGGAGNVMKNLSNLGISVTILSAIGNDNNGQIILDKINKINIDTKTVFQSSDLLTNYKMRIIANNQHVVRADWDSSSLNQVQEAKLCNIVETLSSTVDAVIISDYLKGVCAEKITQKLINTFNQADKPIFVDPKGSSWEKYSGATFITPNIKEISIVLGENPKSNDDFIDAGKKILSKYQIKNCLITRGASGMTFVNNNVSFHIPARAKEVYDVSGAGDTVIACLAVALINKKSIKQAVKLSNKAASLVVSHIGTSAISLEELNNL